MPAANFRRPNINLDPMFAPFRAVAFELVARCLEEGASYHALFALRSFEAQGAMHRRWQEGQGGRAAPPGLSSHQYGVAFDFARDGAAAPGLQPDWADPAYDVLGRQAQAMGLHWGVTYADRLHVSWPGYVDAKQLRPLQTLYLEHLRAGTEGALAAVHLHLEQELRTPAWRAANPRLARELEQLGFLDTPGRPLAAPRSTA